jgi:predicted metal-dependent phosphoesterase TrpH
MLRVEFHCHTMFSKDCLLSPQDLVTACARKGIDRVIVTDHNGIDGALAARAVDPERIIVGEEILTAEGELLTAFVTSRIRPRRSARETIAALRDQGAFISVAHPFDHSRRGAWKEDDLLAIAPLVDAVEVFNSRCMSPAANRAALAFALHHDLAGTVGSDAHTAWELGRATLALPHFNNADELRAVIRQGQSRTRWSPPWIHLTSRYARLRKRLAAGLDTAHRA